MTSCFATTLQDPGTLVPPTCAETRSPVSTADIPEPDNSGAETSAPGEQSAHVPPLTTRLVIA